MRNFAINPAYPVEDVMGRGAFEEMLKNLQFGEEHPLNGAGAFGKAWLLHATAAAARAALEDHETVTQAGALDPDVWVSIITPGTAEVFTVTLANGTRIGQRKCVRVKIAAGDAVARVTLLITSADAGLNSLTFDEISKALEVMWDGEKWFILGGNPEVA